MTEFKIGRDESFKPNGIIEYLVVGDALFGGVNLSIYEKPLEIIRF